MKNEYFLPISFDFLIFYVILPHDETNMKNEKSLTPNPSPKGEGSEK